MAAEKSFNKLVLRGKKATIKWAHSQAKLGVAKTDHRFDVNAMPSATATNPNDFFNWQQEQVTVLPPGMKLHQLPPALIPASSYQMYSQAYAAPYSMPVASTSAAAAASNSLDSIPPPPGIAGGGQVKCIIQVMIPVDSRYWNFLPNNFV